MPKTRGGQFHAFESEAHFVVRGPGRAVLADEDSLVGLTGFGPGRRDPWGAVFVYDSTGEMFVERAVTPCLML